jgi:hypothetical protein
MPAAWTAGWQAGMDGSMTINLRSWADRRIPPVRSSIWEGIVPPLFAYLASPRSIDEIIEWGAIKGHSHSRINNMLAFLSLAGRVRHDDASSCWMHGSELQSCLESWGDRQDARMEQG